MIRRGNGETVYRQVRRQLEAEIRNLHKAGDALPPEAALADRFGVNRHTLRRAIDGLVADGWIERRHGVGSFVLDKPFDYQIRPRTRFTETFEALGRKAESTVLKKLRVPARAMRFLPAAEVVAYTNAGIALATLISILLYREGTEWRLRLMGTLLICAGLASLAIGRSGA